jgi:hypothetical protein
MSRVRIGGVVGLALLAALLGAAPTTQVGEQEKMKAWWEDLSKGEPAASRALLAFADQPAATVSFLHERMNPLKMEPEDLEFSLTALGSDQENVWKPAFELLEYLDPRLSISLDKLMAKVTEPVARQRLVALLCGDPADAFKGRTIQLRSVGGGEFNFSDNNASWWGEAKVDKLTKDKWTRAIRAIVLLEHIGTPEATKLIKQMATGHPDAAPTKEAKAALARMKVTGE